MSNKNSICLTREIVTRILEALERADDELDSFGLGRTHNGRKGLIEAIRILQRCKGSMFPFPKPGEK